MQPQPGAKQNNRWLIDCSRVSVNRSRAKYSLLYQIYVMNIYMFNGIEGNKLPS